MSKTVLVADESVTIRSVAESLLRGEAYSVRSAADGQMALELARTERPDLILVGEKLPGLAGPEVCRALKSDPNLSGVPVVYMRADHPGGTPPGADAVLTKPFSPQAFLDTVQGLLAAATLSGGDMTAPVRAMGATDELIDEALGIDDVGPQPAREIEVSRGTELVADLEEPETPAEEEQAAFGTLEEPGDRESGDAPTVDSEPLEFSTQVGLEDHAAPAPAGGARDSELDRALDLAFGDLPSSDNAGPSRRSLEVPPSSLDEIALGEPEPAVDKGPADHAPMDVFAAGFKTLDSPGAEAEPERPHDYDWFIKEMEKDSAPAASRDARPAPEPPRIEPVATDRSDHHTGDVREAGWPSEQAAANLGGQAKSRTDDEAESGDVQASRPGYEDFISEFRKEIAKLEGAVPSGPAREDTDRMRQSAAGRVAGPEGENTIALPAADIRRLGDELIADVTDKIARELAAKIDAQAIYSLIESKLREQGGR